MQDHQHRTTQAGDARNELWRDARAQCRGGIQIDGERRWDNERGTWELAIADVELRWIDPVPQAGSYTLTTPKGKTAVLSFERIDDDTIAVTLSGGRKDLVFNVTRAGAVSDEGDA